MDVRMPRMDGFTSGKLIRGYRPLSKVPIIYLTAAYAEEEIHPDGCIEADRYMTKPFDLNQFRSVVHRLLFMNGNA